MPPKRSDEFTDWTPVNAAEKATIGDGQKATFTFKPDGSGMWIRTVAASKFAGFTYEVKVDGNTIFGEVGIPPTDVDDLMATHDPPLGVDDELKVIVRNASGGTGSQDVAAQIVGAEVNA